MRILILLILLISFYSCSVSNKQSRNFKNIIGVKPSLASADSSVFIKDTTRSYDPGLQFVYLESAILGEVHSFILKENNTTPLLLKKPTFLIQMNVNDGNLYYVHPNALLKAFKNKEGDIEFVDLNGNKERNKELNFFNTLTYQTGSLNSGIMYSPNLLGQKNYPSTIQEIEALFNKLKLTRLSFLDSSFTQFTTSENFIEIAKTIIDYAAIKDSLILYFNFKDVLNQSQTYQLKLSNNINTINNLNTEPTYLFDDLCETMLNILVNNSVTKALQVDEKEFYNNVDTINKYFKNSAKDYLFTSQYLQASKKYFITDSVFKIIVSGVTNEGYKNLIFAAHTKQEIRKKGNGNKLVSLRGKNISIDDLFFKNKGKLVLIDFWASWCVPCRENMPFSKQLEEKYKNDEVVFIYISLDENITKWKVASLTENLDFHHSFNLQNSRQSPFVEKYKIEEIPRYLLLDRNTQVIYSTNEIANNVELQNLINEHLKTN